MRYPDIDYYGDNGNPMKRPFLLSRLLLPFKTVRTFGLLLRPYELNIKYSIPGEDLFLYDTEEAAEINFSPEYHNRQYFYLYGTSYVDTKPLEWETDRLKNLVSTHEQTISSQEQIISSQEQMIYSKRRQIKHWKNRTIIISVIFLIFIISVSLTFVLS